MKGLSGMERDYAGTWRYIVVLENETLFEAENLNKWVTWES
jgi:hypothetical protein